MTKNPYKAIYPHADWTYTYECPNCCEPVPLAIDYSYENSAPFYPELIGHCQNCKLDIRIFEEKFEEWKKNQQGELSPRQEDAIGDQVYHDRKCEGGR